MLFRRICSDVHDAKTIKYLLEMPENNVVGLQHIRAWINVSGMKRLKLEESIPKANLKASVGMKHPDFTDMPE